MNNGDDELLAPAIAPTPEDEAEYVKESEPLPSDGGFGDNEGIVRIWLEEGQLSRVRVSPVWHAKLGRRTLDECFTEALALANALSSIRIAPVVDIEEKTFVDDFGSLPRFGSESFAAFQTLFDDVERRWEEVLQAREDHPPRPRPDTVATYKGVRVSLDETGRAHRVDFDKKWLEKAQAGMICAHVMRAAEAAYERFVPVVESDPELDGLRSEHEFLQAAFKAMLNPGSGDTS